MHTETYASDTVKSVSATIGAALTFIAQTFGVVPEVPAVETLNLLTGFALAGVAMFYGGRRLLAAIRSTD